MKRMQYIYIYISLSLSLCVCTVLCPTVSHFGPKTDTSKERQQWGEPGSASPHEPPLHATKVSKYKT